MQNWTSTFFYAIMASYGAQQLGGYGVSDNMTKAGGSVSMALYTATSVRVGNLLGQNSIERAKQAAWAGITFSTIAGAVLGAALYFGRYALAALFSPTDEGLQHLIQQSTGPLAVFYFLNSVVYGLWAVLEAQSRPAIPTMGMVMTEWFISIPLTLLLLKTFCISHVWNNMSTLEVVWHARNVGQIILILVMSNAVRNSDWEQVAKEATECAEVDAESNTSPVANGQESYYSGACSTRDPSHHSIPHHPIPSYIDTTWACGGDLHSGTTRRIKRRKTTKHSVCCPGTELSST